MVRQPAPEEQEIVDGDVVALGDHQPRARAAAEIGEENLIGVDMGGTSYDVCLVRNGAPDVKAGWNWHHRYLVGLPMVDVQSIGAGGGSIAWLGTQDPS